MRYIIYTYEQLGEQPPFCRALGPEAGQTYPDKESAEAAAAEFKGRVDPSLKISFMILPLEGITDASSD